MVAYAGSLRLLAGEAHGLDFTVKPRWPLASLSPPGTACDVSTPAAG